MFKALIRLILYVGLVLVPIMTATAVGSGSDSFLHTLGKYVALAAFVIILLQVILAARIKWIERAFGLDIVIRFHRNMALFAAVFLLSHPVLLAASKGHWNLLFALDLPWNIWLGKIALFILIFNVLISSYQKKLNLKFEHWRIGHNISGLLIITLIFLHSWFAGDDLKPVLMQSIWVILVSGTGLIYLYHKVFLPLKLKHHTHQVVDVHQEAPDVWTIKLAPPAGETITPYLPGQFHFVTFYRNDTLPVEEHHWTISSSPAENGYVSSTIKALGDFTATIGQTRMGDRAAVHGPFGRFSHALHPDETNLVFIAGGIGITPLMGMLRYMRDTQDTRSVLLLYANREAEKIVFRQELEAIANSQYPDLKVVHILDKPQDGWTGDTGYLDREKIERYCSRDDLKKNAFYICGPQKMREAVINDLKDLGVPERRIHMEIFSFLD